MGAQLQAGQPNQPNTHCWFHNCKDAAAACSSCQPGGGSSTKGCVPPPWEGGFGGWVSQERHGPLEQRGMFYRGGAGSVWMGGASGQNRRLCSKMSRNEIPFEGSCHQLASTGPCQPGHWLLLVEVKDGQVVAECQERKCEETSEVWWQPSCSCLGNATVRTGVNPCGEEGQVVLSPYGQGICSYPADTVSQQQFQPRVQVTQDQGKIGNRIFENIPVNDETAFS